VDGGVGEGAGVDGGSFIQTSRSSPTTPTNYNTRDALLSETFADEMQPLLQYQVMATAPPIFMHSVLIHCTSYVHTLCTHTLCSIYRAVLGTLREG
jgi:hypothetical protein